MFVLQEGFVCILLQTGFKISLTSSSKVSVENILCRSIFKVARKKTLKIMLIERTTSYLGKLW